MKVSLSCGLAFTVCLLGLPDLARGQVVGGGIGGQPTAPPRDRVVPPRVGNAVIRGKVVDGVTGAPISRARVRVMGGPGQQPPVLTDADGQFAITGVAAGSFTVMAEKATYVVGRFPEAQRSLRARSTPATVRPGQTLDVTVPMFRGSSITGRVLDAHGDPVEFAQVQVLTVRRGQPPMMRQQFSTNDLGEFRVGRLESGKYLVMVLPRAMYNEDPNAPPNPNPIPVPTPMYYPNAMTLDQAQPITLNRGQSVSGIDFTLGEGMPTIVTGTVVSAEGPLSEPNGSVNARMAGTESMGSFSTGGSGIRPDGSFRLQLAPGEYVIEARISPRVSPTQPYQPRNEQFGRVRVSAGVNPVEAVTIVVGRGATASGRVTFEGDSPVPAPPNGGDTHIPLFGEGPACRSGQATITPDWTFKVDGLGGTCSAPVSGMLGRWAIKSVIFRGENIMDKTITFEQGQQYTNLQIVVTDKRPEVELFVAGEDGQPTRDYVAIAFSANKARWTTRYIRTFVPRTRPLPPPPGIVGGAASVSNQMSMIMPNGQPQTGVASQSGSTRDLFPNLPPGEFFIVAVDDIDSEDYTDPAVLERLTAHATRITVTDDARIEVPLRRVPIADIIR
jgi:Carboxypeptidase regulatory-like domain